MQSNLNQPKQLVLIKKLSESDQYLSRTYDSQQDKPTQQPKFHD